MPIPLGFDNTVIRVNATPVTAADLNTAISTQNTAEYYVTDIKFTDADNAFLLCAKDLAEDTQLQKVNLVTQTQAAIDADKATEIADGYWPTGVFSTPGYDLLILYQQLDEPST